LKLEVDVADLLGELLILFGELIAELVDPPGEGADLIFEVRHPAEQLRDQIAIAGGRRGAARGDRHRDRGWARLAAILTRLKGVHLRLQLQDLVAERDAFR